MEGSWASLGCVLEPLGAFSGALEALSEALGAVLGQSCGSPRRLTTEIGEMRKTLQNHKKINVFGGVGGSKMRPSWAKLGARRTQVGISRRSWSQDGRRWPKMAKMALKMRLESAKMPFWRRLGASLGSEPPSPRFQPPRPRAGPARRAGPVFVFFEEEDLVRLSMVI